MDDTRDASAAIINLSLCTVIIFVPHLFWLSSTYRTCVSEVVCERLKTLPRSMYV